MSDNRKMLRFSCPCGGTYEAPDTFSKLPARWVELHAACIENRVGNLSAQHTAALAAQAQVFASTTAAMETCRAARVVELEAMLERAIAQTKAIHVPAPAEWDITAPCLKLGEGRGLSTCRYMVSHPFPCVRRDLLCHVEGCEELAEARSRWCAGHPCAEPGDDDRCQLSVADDPCLLAAGHFEPCSAGYDDEGRRTVVVSGGYGPDGPLEQKAEVVQWCPLSAFTDEEVNVACALAVGHEPPCLAPKDLPF